VSRWECPRPGPSYPEGCHLNPSRSPPPQEAIRATLVREVPPSISARAPAGRSGSPRPGPSDPDGIIRTLDSFLLSRPGGLACCPGCSTAAALADLVKAFEQVPLKVHTSQKSIFLQKVLVLQEVQEFLQLSLYF